MLISAHWKLSHWRLLGNMCQAHECSNKQVLLPQPQAKLDRALTNASPQPKQMWRLRCKQTDSTKKRIVSAWRSRTSIFTYGQHRTTSDSSNLTKCHLRVPYLEHRRQKQHLQSNQCILNHQEELQPLVDLSKPRNLSTSSWLPLRVALSTNRLKKCTMQS